MWFTVKLEQLVAVRRALRRRYHAVALSAVDLSGLTRHVAQHLHRGLVRRAQRNRPLLQAYLVLKQKCSALETCFIPIL